jgi:hypothetical protein
MQPKADYWTLHKSLICLYDSQNGPICMIPTPIFLFCVQFLLSQNCLDLKIQRWIYIHINMTGSPQDGPKNV